MEETLGIKAHALVCNLLSLSTSYWIVASGLDILMAHVEIPMYYAKPMKN